MSHRTAAGSRTDVPGAALEVTTGKSRRGQSEEGGAPETAA
jgi:hypothetical protein